VNADRLTITPDVAGATLRIDGDTSGFLAAAHVQEGTVGTTLNTAAHFDGTGANAPMFDPGHTVHAGSFTVNGVRIDVAGDDSVDSVLAKITSSRAGVTASFDTQQQTVTLASKAASATPINLGSDDSGFLRAVKLDGSAISTAGTATMSGYAAAIGDVHGFQSVRAGSLTVNGKTLAIDPRTTTLRSLAASVNHLFGADASLDESTGKLTISAANGGALDLADTSGILSALGLAEGHYAGAPQNGHPVRVPVGTRSVSNSAKVASDLAIAASNLNFAFTRFGVTADDQGARSPARQLAELGQLFKAFGIEGVSTQSDAGTALKLDVDEDALARSLDENAPALAGFLQQGGALSAGLEQSLATFAEAAVLAASSPSGTALTDMLSQLKSKSASGKTAA
jgi:hypothetical protein